MGVQRRERDAVYGLMKGGHYRFVAIFTWSGQEDKVAVERLRPYIGHKFPEKMGIESDTAQFYYLTGARTVLVIGYTKSGIGLQQFCSSIIFGTDIKVSVHHAVEGYEAAEAVPQ